MTKTYDLAGFETDDTVVPKFAVFHGSELDVVNCPFCHYDFAVSDEYLRDVDIVVHCPMCCMEVFIL